MPEQQSVPYQPTHVSFTRRQIAEMSPAEYRQHRPQILDAMRRGDVKDDISEPALKANIQEQLGKKNQQGE